jgi:hypothetical protein
VFVPSFAGIQPIISELIGRVSRLGNNVSEGDDVLRSVPWLLTTPNGFSL